MTFKVYKTKEYTPHQRSPLYQLNFQLKLPILKLAGAEIVLGLVQERVGMDNLEVLVIQLYTLGT
jgi:hypothetical protein